MARYSRSWEFKENVRRNVRYLFELGVVRSLLGEMLRYLIELGVVRSLLEKCQRYCLSWEL